MSTRIRDKQRIDRTKEKRAGIDRTKCDGRIRLVRVPMPEKFLPWCIVCEGARCLPQRDGAKRYIMAIDVLNGCGEFDRYGYICDDCQREHDGREVKQTGIEFDEPLQSTAIKSHYDRE